MGTRADFYVGEGAGAEWIGSVAWDGYEWGERIAKGDHDAITEAKTESDYREAVAAMIASRQDGTTPTMGWPWPWANSKTTDCAYCFADGAVKAFSWGEPWDSDNDAKAEWPDMGRNQNPPMDARSGLIVLRG